MGVLFVFLNDKRHKVLKAANCAFNPTVEKWLFLNSYFFPLSPGFLFP